jgi:hypothetical protein
MFLINKIIEVESDCSFAIDLAAFIYVFMFGGLG